MKFSALYTVILIALFYLLSAQRASAQDTYAYTTLTYDGATNTVRGYSVTYPDYNVQGYYSSKAAIGLSSWNPDGSDLVYHGGETIEGPYYGIAEANVQAPYTPGRVYSSGSDHYHKTIYEEWFYPPEEWREAELRSVDYYNFHSYEGPGGGGITYEYSYVFHGPGPRYLLNQGTQDIYLGGTLLTLEAAPVITSLSPDRGLIGDAIDVTITGQRLGNPQNSSLTTVNVPTNSGITVSNVTVNSKTEVTVRFTMDANANGGTVLVTLKYRNQTSNSVNFFVQIPTTISVPVSLGRIPFNGQTLYGTNGLPVASTFYGYAHSFKYTVLDQAGQPIISNKMFQAEDVTAVSDNPQGIGSNQFNSSVTKPDGTFEDFFTFGYTTAPAPQPGEFIKYKQGISISIAGTSWGAILKVNCINKQYNDVTITDITATPNVSCQ